MFKSLLVVGGKKITMFIAAIIIYLIFAIILGPLWPLQMYGKGGPIGKLVVVLWVVLFIAGLNAK